MKIVKCNQLEVKLLARLMRAEAEACGKEGMLCIGEVGVNRIRTAFFSFNAIRTVTNMIFQDPGGFETTTKSSFYQAARKIDVALAKQSLKGRRIIYNKTALWFYRLNQIDACNYQWFFEFSSGRYKSYCFCQPLEFDQCE